MPGDDILEKSTIDRSFEIPVPLRLLAAGLGRTSPRLAAHLAQALFLRPPRFSRPRREWRWLEAAEPIRFPAGSDELSGWSWGAGPTVLLIHGWAGRGSQLGAFAAPLVERGCRVVTFDGPGHGASSGRRSSLPEFARAVRRVGDELWPLRGIVAHSFGTAATTVALAQGLVVDRLVYVAPPADLSYFTDGFVRLLGFPPQTARGLESLLEKRFGFRWAELQPLALVQAVEMPPGLLIHDLEDEEVPHEQASALAAAWPGARLMPTRGLGHHGVLRDGEVVEEAARFLGTAARETVRAATGSAPPECNRLSVPIS